MFDDIDTPQTGGISPQTPRTGQTPPSPQSILPRPRPVQPMPLSATVPPAPPLQRPPAPPPNLPMAKELGVANTTLPTAPLPEDIFSSADTIPVVSGEFAAEPPIITPLGGAERSSGAPMPPISLPEQGGGGFRKAIVFLLAALIVALLGVGAYLVYRIVKTRDNVDIVNQPIENGGEQSPTGESEEENEPLIPPVVEEEGDEEEPTVTKDEEQEEAPPPVEQPVDTDNDGLTDLEELGFSSNPRFIDTDMDKLDDYSEVRIYHSDPARRDTDGDGYDDGLEVQNGYSPTGAGKLTSE